MSAVTAEQILVEEIRGLRSKLQSIIRHIDRLDERAREVSARQNERHKQGKVRMKHARYIRVLQYHHKGWSWQDIGEKLDIIPNYAKKIHREAVQAVNDRLLGCDISGNKINGQASEVPQP